MVDGERIRTLRLKKGYTQEKLAIMARVNKRTVQRAENGCPLGIETVAFMAEALEVVPSTLMGPQRELEFNSDGSTAEGEVVLVPIRSGQRLVRLLRSSFVCVIEYDVEPTRANVDSLRILSGLLDYVRPDPSLSPYDSRRNISDGELLGYVVDLNELMDELSAAGVTFFAGSYPSLRQIPHYDPDEGCMSHYIHAPYEEVQIGHLVISESTSDHMRIRPGDHKAVQNIPAAAPKETEIPFDSDIPF